MVSELTLDNFKAFVSFKAEMRNLTVLTGLNSSGKSSMIQALLLCELARNGPASVPLNGPFGLSLGEATDVLSFEAKSSDIGIRLRGDGWTDRFEFDIPPNRAVSLPLRPFRPSGRQPRLASYLSAERLGPRDLLEVDPAMQVVLGDEGDSKSTNEPLSVGHQGQYAPHVLAQYDRRQIREPIRHPGFGEGEDVAITLTTQAELWLSAIVRPISLQATWLPGTNAATVRFREPDTRTEWMRPPNVGFGFSYALPIVVAALTATPGTMLIVESPEAHLHPAGQSAIGHFLAQVAGSGVQTVVETHSDHVLNGVRRAVADSKVIPSEDVVVHFFGHAGAAHLKIKNSGAVTDWPDGFFDQTETDLSLLARIRTST